MTDTTLSAISQIVGVPKGAMPEFAVSCITWLDAKSGEQLYGYAIHGDAPMGTLIGVLEMVKQSIILNRE